jgi:uncharacterized protein YcbK (DUF882 family)
MMVWNNIKYFRPTENWGDSKRMNPMLLILLDKLRDIIGKPISINCGYETEGHEPNSQHGYGNAVDFHVKGMKFKEANQQILAALDIIIIAGRKASDLVGYGIYPHWNTAGFHLDVRGYKARWGALNRDGKQTYVSFDEALKAIKD